MRRVDRCAYAVHDGAQGTQAKHRYKIRSTWKLEAVRQCSCDEHQALNAQSSKQLGVYPASLVTEIINSLTDHYCQ